MQQNTQNVSAPKPTDFKNIFNSFHPKIQSLLENRFKSLEAIEQFLSWDLKKLPDLRNLIDLDIAAQRLIKAIENEESIAVYGDYDVDGTTSCALLCYFFKMLNIEIKHYQPSRFVEGYGVHNSSIDQAIEDQVSVLVTVDCGISNVATAEYALEKGIDLIITDHHKDAAEKIPPAYAVVNPNRRDQANDDLDHLAGVGVAFALCLEMKTILEKSGKTCPSLYPLLQFVAIGTICDMAVLNPMNVKLTRHGLKQIPSSIYEGLKVFLSKDELNESTIASEKCSFLIGPMINSKGRLDHPELALKLLLTDNHQDAFNIFYQLKNCNNERKFIQAEVFKEAQDAVIEQISDKNSKQEHLISIVHGENWHEGVIGIVASRLVETFKVPAIVFSNSEQEGIIKASARSAGELNIFNLLDQCRDLFIKFGGHKAAAGLSMPLENLAEFKQRMNGFLADIPRIERTLDRGYDLELKFEDITPKLVHELNILEPFGMGNSKPIFKSRDFHLKNYTLLKEKHVKWQFHSPELNTNLFGISFNYIGKWGALHPEDIIKYHQQNKQAIEVIYTLGINKFRGNETIQLMVDDISVS